MNKKLQSVLQAIEDNASGTAEQWNEVKSLIEQGVDSNTVTKETGNSALHLALSDPNKELIQNLDIITFLTNHHADYNKENNMGYTAQAIKDQLEKIQQGSMAVQLQRSSPPVGSDSEQLNENLKCMLNELDQDKNRTNWPSYWESIMELISKGADINVQNNNGNTALHLAAAEDNVGKVYTLLGYTRSKNTINTKILNNNNQTPYDIARSLRNEAITNMLSSHYLPYDL